MRNTDIMTEIFRNEWIKHYMYYDDNQDVWFVKEFIKGDWEGMQIIIKWYEPFDGPVKILPPAKIYNNETRLNENG